MNSPSPDDPVLEPQHTLWAQDALIATWPAVPPVIPDIRRRVRDWLQAQRWPIEDAEDIVLAVNEAATNVIDHAYSLTEPQSIDLHAWVFQHQGQPCGRRIGITVTDHGRWRPVVDGEHRQRFRGLGLAVVGGVMADCQIHRSAAGTTVLLISRTESFLDSPPP